MTRVLQSSNRRMGGLPILGWLLLGLLAGCSHRETGEISVDDIQSRVDQVEAQLREAGAALRSKNLDLAEEKYQEAVEVFEENRKELADYPEVGMLQERIQKTSSDLCYERVNVRLESFFAGVRNKNPDEARSRRKEVEEEFQRCQERIGSRSDFVALKMNVESIPQAITDLENELARVDKLKKIKAFQEEIAPQIQSIRTRMSKLQKQPYQRELALELGRDIPVALTALAQPKDFGDDPEWVGYASATSEELKGFSSQREQLVRRGRVLWVVREVLPKAFAAASRVGATKERESAMKLANTAIGNYRQCETVLNGALKKEPELGKFDFQWQKGKKTVAWLKSHCVANRLIFERLLQKISQRKEKPLKPTPAAGGEKPTAPDGAGQEKKTKTPKRRVRRW